MMLFQDRADAGWQLAKPLTHYQNQNPIVLALPRGGVPVGFEVAKVLNAPLDIILVRKLGVPNQPELAMGAIASGGVRVLNHEIVRSLNIPDQVIEQVTTKEQQELMRRDRLYRGDRPAMDVRDRIVILVDDGLATGSTMQAAVTAVKQQQPAQIVVAVPLAVSEVCDRFQQQVDEVVCLMSPEPFHAVGLWYKDFSQTADQEVQKLLQEAVCA